MDKNEQEREFVIRMTRAMREADREFERVGGSTRHHVRDCLLPILGKHGLKLSLRYLPSYNGSSSKEDK